MNRKLDKKEAMWQVAFKNFVNTEHREFVSQDSIKVSILSIGEHNKFEGPDFRNACIRINGNVTIGDIEFHKKSSDWLKHNHSTDPNYNNVLLHIVFEEDSFFQNRFKTIVLNREVLKPYYNIKTDNVDTIANEDCKYLSILRLLRKTENANNLLKINSIDNVLFSMLTDFLIRYSGFRTRYFNQEIDLARIFSLLQNSLIYTWLCKKNKNKFNIDVLFKEFVEETNLGDITKHLKQEILINVILPIAFCITSTSIKTQLLLWYHSAKTRSKYGILKRVYPFSEQKYIWQQQGMLEYHNKNYNFQFSSFFNTNFSNTEL
jgi:hypothetical protein